MSNPAQASIKEGFEFFLKFVVSFVPVLDKENARFLVLQDVTKDSAEFKRPPLRSKSQRKAIRDVSGDLRTHKITGSIFPRSARRAGVSNWRKELR